jgi:hypothetical protein
LIERVILSAGAMLIFSVSFQIDQMPEGRREEIKVIDNQRKELASLVGKPGWPNFAFLGGQ